MGIKQANKSLRFIFIMLCAIVLGYIVMFEPLYEMIDHSPLVNLTIVSVQIIGVIYTFFAYISLKRGVKDWIRFERQPISNISDVNNIKFGGAIRMLSNRLSELLYAKNEARNALLNALHDSFNRRSDAAGYLSGLLVSLGLLGTFIGLTRTMGDIKSAVDSAIDGGGSDISTLLGGIAAPLGGMSAAFGASLLGLLGSIIMGLAAHMLSSASENLYEEIDEWTFAHYQPDESVIGILNGENVAEGTNNTNTTVGTKQFSHQNGQSIFGSQIVHLLNSIHLDSRAAQERSTKQMEQIASNLQMLLASQEKLITQQNHYEGQQLQSLQNLESQQQSVLTALAQQNQSQQAVHSQLVSSQTETISSLDYLAQLSNDSLSTLQTLEQKLFTGLANVHGELIDVNLRLNEQCQQNQNTVTYYENVVNSFDRVLITLSENIAFLNENKVATSNIFEQVSDSLINLKGETQGVRQQLLEIDSVLRERNSESGTIVNALKAQNNTLLASLNEITKARATILAKHSNSGEIA